ncbi:MAG TPA: sugar phosphate nucleotidyltransferase [Acidimicrobiales bacterium]|jgi:NDP-sugar pyrophosphorylase family protein|nr:sugar phosphate nucleotidyltransferase [Acidimicrobiales bacterium]
MGAMMPETPTFGPTELCAVVLAAGEGARLRPLTRVLPKPLCPVDGIPLIDHAIERARSAIRAVAVNVHHGREAVEAHLDGRVHVSVEEPEALGTAGALGRLRPWIDGRATLVLNGDTWCPGSLAGFVAGWGGTRVRLALAGGGDRLRPTSRVAAALMPWGEVARLAPVAAGLYEASWRALAAADRIEVVRWDGPCLDCGTPARYLAANLAASGGMSVIGPGASVDGEVVRSVVWEGAGVRAGERLVDAVRASDDVTVLVR